MTVVVLPSTIMVTSHVHYLDRLACGHGKGAAQAQETKDDAAVAEMSDISSSPYSVQITRYASIHVIFVKINVSRILGTSAMKQEGEMR